MSTGAVVATALLSMVPLWLALCFVSDHRQHKRRMREHECNRSLLAKARWEIRQGNMAEARELLADFERRRDRLWKTISLE